MPKETHNLVNSVMERIHEDKIKIRPKIYSILGSLFLFLGLTASILTSIFLFGLMRFSLRSHGPMGEYRFAQMVSSFPWWTVIVAVVGMIVGIYLLQKYDFSYKINSRVMVIGFVFSIILAC